MKRLRQLEEENAKLKRIVADLSLDKAMLQDVLSKKLQGRASLSWIVGVILAHRRTGKARKACPMARLRGLTYPFAAKIASGGLREKERKNAL